MVRITKALEQVAYVATVLEGVKKELDKSLWDSISANPALSIEKF